MPDAARSTSCAAICAGRRPTTQAVAERQPRLVAARPALVARRRGAAAAPPWSCARRRPTQVAAVARAVQRRTGVPLTVAGGRSGVSGASVPVFGGVVLDITGLAGHRRRSTRRRASSRSLAGTFGPDLERELQDDHGLSVGHFPQSFDLATVGGWVACRGAGQYSTRYGKIEDIVVGLEVVLADGTVVRTGGAPAAAVGPDLTQLFLGSEGTLGVVTRVWLRAHPVPAAERRAAYTFAVVRRRHRGLPARSCARGATPAVLRLYDARRVGARPRRRRHDAARCSCSTRATRRSSTPRWRSSTDVRRRPAAPADADELVADWLEHRNDTSRAAGPDPQGLRRRHDGDRRAVVAAARACSTTSAPR